MHHHHTVPGQMLQMFPRYEFEKAVKETNCRYAFWTTGRTRFFGLISRRENHKLIQSREIREVLIYDSQSLRSSCEEGQIDCRFKISINS